MKPADSSTPFFAIPGLGTDERIFGPLSKKLPLIPLPWLKPDAQESLRSYAARMAIAIDHPQPWLLGVSFGGMLAQEIARLRPIKGVILISSLKPQDPKARWMRWAQKVPFYRLSRGSWRYRTLSWWSPIFGVKTRQEQALLKSMFANFRDDYRMWAIEQFVNWEGKTIELPYLHLHGQQDRAIPARNLQQVTLVENGNHFMVYQRAEEIAQHISAWQERKALKVAK